MLIFHKGIEKKQKITLIPSRKNDIMISGKIFVTVGGYIMRKILPIILILLGIAEIILAVMDIEMPILIAIVLGVMFVALGVKTLLDACKK